MHPALSWDRQTKPSSWTSRGRKYRVWRQGAEAEPHPAPGAQTADQEKEAQRGTEAT